MSHTYHFLCVDCGSVVDVGKIADIDETGGQLPIGFCGWRDQTTGRWLSGTELWHVLEKWHIIHRGHEVRLVPESFLDRADPTDKLSYVDSAGEVIDARIEPLPDDEEDAERVDSGVIPRLAIVRGAT